MPKRGMSLLLVVLIVLSAVSVSCASARQEAEVTPGRTETRAESGTGGENGSDASGSASAGAGAETVIRLSDAGVTVNGRPATANPEDAVHTGAAIVYYEAGRGRATARVRLGTNTARKRRTSIRSSPSRSRGFTG